MNEVKELRFQVYNLTIIASPNTEIIRLQNSTPQTNICIGGAIFNCYTLK